MNKLIINNNQLISIVNDDLQKNIIELATYQILLKRNEIKENINYEKELIENIKFLNILKEDLKIKMKKNEILINDFVNVNWTFTDNIMRSFYYTYLAMFILIFVIIPIANFIPILSILWISIIIIPVLSFFGKPIFRTIKNKFLKWKIKKINNKNKFFKEKIISKILTLNKVKRKEYNHFKKEYLFNIYQKMKDNQIKTSNKKNENNFKSDIINSFELSNQPSTSEYKLNLSKI